MTLVCRLCRRVFWVAFVSLAGARQCPECGRLIVGNCVTAAMSGDTLRVTVDEQQQRSDAA